MINEYRLIYKRKKQNTKKNKQKLMDMEASCDWFVVE